MIQVKAWAVYATLGLWLGWAWMTMTLTHELGHVIGGLSCGASLSVIEIRPWHLPHSLFSPDPNPLATLWAGPILGCVCPLLAAILMRRNAIWFVAWFCVLANTTYLLVGYFTGDGELDTAKLFHAGTSPILFWLFILMIGPVSYVGFRDQCIQLISQPRHAMGKRAWCISMVALVLVIATQSVAGSMLR